MNRLHSRIRSCQRLPPFAIPLRASRMNFSGSIFRTASLICLPNPLRSKGNDRFWLHVNSNDLAPLLSDAPASALVSLLASPARCPGGGGGAPGDADGGVGRRAASSFSASAAVILPSSSILRMRAICSSIDCSFLLAGRSKILKLPCGLFGRDLPAIEHLEDQAPIQI